MALSLPGQISQTVGQPASVRIGTVVGVNPLSVSLQGRVLNAEAVGVSGSLAPVVGASVVLLGQSKTQGSDPSSWLIVGMQAPSASVSGPQFMMDGTDQSAFTATSYVAGTPVVGFGFNAPPSGQVRIDWHARFQTNTTNTRSLVSVQVAEGLALDAGTVVLPASDSRAIENANDAVGGVNSRMQAAMYTVVNGLTPGGEYNAVVKFRMATAGNGDIFDRSILITPM